MKVKGPCIEKRKVIQRAINKIQRGGSTVNLLKLTEEEINTIKKSYLKKYDSESLLFRTKLRDLCYRLDQVNVITTVSENNFEALRQAKMRTDNNLPESTAQPAISQGSFSSDTTSTTSDTFQNKQYPPNHIQYLEYLAKPKATPMPQQLTGQVQLENFVKPVGQNIEKELFLSFYTNQKSSDSSDDTNESKKSDSSSSKASEHLDNSDEAKDIISLASEKIDSTVPATTTVSKIVTVTEEFDFSSSQPLVEKTDKEAGDSEDEGRIFQD